MLYIIQYILEYFIQLISLFIKNPINSKATYTFSFDIT